MQHITIGKVSHRTGARQHYNIAGRAACGAGRATIMHATRWRVDATVDAATVCRRCLPKLRAALVAAPDTDHDAKSAALTLMPADQAAAWEADMLARLRADIAADRAAVEPPAPLSWTAKQELLARLLSDESIGQLELVAG